MHHFGCFSFLLLLLLLLCFQIVFSKSFSDSTTKTTKTPIPSSPNWCWRDRDEFGLNSALKENFIRFVKERENEWVQKMKGELCLKFFQSFTMINDPGNKSHAFKNYWIHCNENTYPYISYCAVWNGKLKREIDHLISSDHSDKKIITEWRCPIHSSQPCLVIHYNPSILKRIRLSINSILRWFEFKDDFCIDDVRFQKRENEEL